MDQDKMSEAPRPVTREMAAEIREELHRILTSRAFRQSGRLRAFLSYCVEQTLQAPHLPLKEYAIGVQALGNPALFDPRLDPIVRVDAHRLRLKLERYYRDVAPNGRIRICFPNRGYRPVFELRSAGASPAHSVAGTSMPAPPPPDISRESYRSYLRGRHYLARRTADAVEKAAACFEKALDETPEFSDALAALASAYVLLGVSGDCAPNAVMPKARQAALSALRVHEEDAEAHAALGVVRAVYEYDWAAAEREFQRAIAAQPDRAEAHLWYGHFCLLPLGRFEEAAQQIRLALEMNPLHAVGFALGAWGHYVAGQFEEAWEYCRQALDLEPYYYLPRLLQGSLLEKVGKLEQALSQYQESLSCSGDSALPLGHIGRVLARMGRLRQAREVLARLHALSQKRYVAAVNFAMVHLGLGEVDTAVVWLQRAWHNRCSLLAWLGLDPFFEPLRRHAVGCALLRKIFRGQAANGPLFQRAGLP